MGANVSPSLSSVIDRDRAGNGGSGGGGLSATAEARAASSDHARAVVEAAAAGMGAARELGWEINWLDGEAPRLFLTIELTQGVPHSRPPGGPLPPPYRHNSHITRPPTLTTTTTHHRHFLELREAFLSADINQKGMLPSSVVLSSLSRAAPRADFRDFVSLVVILTMYPTLTMHIPY